MPNYKSLLQRKRSISIGFILIFIVTLGMRMWVSGNAMVQEINHCSRMIIKESDLKPPVKISLIKTRKGAIETEKEFLDDDDDWFKGLTLRVVNNSKKPITYIGISLIFQRTQDQEQGLPAGWTLDYGLNPFRFKSEEAIPTPQVSPVLPGDSMEINLSDAEYNEIKRFLKDAGFPASVKKIEMNVIITGFSDGTAWNTGRMYRRDPQSPNNWIPLGNPKQQNSAVEYG